MDIDITKIDFERIYNFKKQQSAALSFAQDIVVYDDEYLTESSIFDIETIAPIRIDSTMYFLCLDGEMNMSLNYSDLCIKKGSVLVLNGHHIIDNIRVNRYRGYVLLFSPEFVLYILNRIPEFQEMVVGLESLRSLIELGEEDMERFIQIIEQLKYKLRNTEHPFYSRIVKIEAISFVLELAAMFINEREKRQSDVIKQHKGNSTFQQFIALVIKYCCKQHKVSFYAMQLHMCPENLSRSISKESGIPPIKWINRALLAEAKILLRCPTLNIQQVAFELNFANQSSFGKFFRKHTGLTPIQYKENLKG